MRGCCLFLKEFLATLDPLVRVVTPASQERLVELDAVESKVLEDSLAFRASREQQVSKVSLVPRVVLVNLVSSAILEKADSLDSKDCVVLMDSRVTAEHRVIPDPPDHLVSRAQWESVDLEVTRDRLDLSDSQDSPDRPDSLEPQDSVDGRGIVVILEWLVSKVRLDLLERPDQLGRWDHLDKSVKLAQWEAEDSTASLETLDL